MIWKVSITGQGINGLKKPKNELNAKNSGTTARLLIGLLSKQKFSSTLIGSTQLNKRPMNRIANLLVDHGADMKIKNNSAEVPIAVIVMMIIGIIFNIMLLGVDVVGNPGFNVNV